MAKTPKPATPPAAALPMPASGGAWLRLADGTLIRDPAEHPPGAGAVETPVELPVQSPLKDT